MILCTCQSIPVSVAIHDSLSESPSFIKHEDPKMLVQLFVEELQEEVRSHLGRS